MNHSHAKSVSMTKAIFGWVLRRSSGGIAVGDPVWKRFNRHLVNTRVSEEAVQICEKVQNRFFGDAIMLQWRITISISCIKKNETFAAQWLYIMLMLCLKRSIKKQSESYHLSQYWGNGLCNARAGYDCVPRQDDVSQDRPVILIAASWPQKIHGLISREYDLAMPAHWTNHNDHYSNFGLGFSKQLLISSTAEQGRNNLQARSDHHLVTPQCRMKYRRLWSTTSVRCSSGTGDRYGIGEARIFATRLSWREGWETVHPAGVFGAKPSSRSFENVVSGWKDEIWNKIPWFFNQNPGLKHI